LIYSEFFKVLAALLSLKGTTIYIQFSDGAHHHLAVRRFATFWLQFFFRSHMQGVLVHFPSHQSRPIATNPSGCADRVALHLKADTQSRLKTGTEPSHHLLWNQVPSTNMHFLEVIDLDGYR
jgi:hypothetical protein